MMPRNLTGKGSGRILAIIIAAIRMETLPWWKDHASPARLRAGSRKDSPARLRRMLHDHGGSAGSNVMSSRAVVRGLTLVAAGFACTVPAIADDTLSIPSRTLLDEAFRTGDAKAGTPIQVTGRLAGLREGARSRLSSFSTERTGRSAGRHGTEASFRPCTVLPPSGSTTTPRGALAMSWSIRRPRPSSCRSMTPMARWRRRPARPGSRPTDPCHGFLAGRPCGPLRKPGAFPCRVRPRARDTFLSMPPATSRLTGSGGGRCADTPVSRRRGRLDAGCPLLRLRRAPGRGGARCRADRVSRHLSCLR